jgi:hypothetical protein
MYRRFTVVAGKTIITRCTDSSVIKTQKGRKPKMNPTSEAVAKINRINQERELTAKLNTNFKPGDWWITLSNAAGVTVEESMEKIGKLKRGLQRYCKRNGLPFKLVETVGIGKRKGKVHHHIVMNQEIPLQMLYRYWDMMEVFAQPLKGYNYQKVAAYILKNAQESKDKRGKFMKAYRCSRQVVRPEQRVEVMKRQATFDTESLKPRKGYQIDRDSIRIYDHPITGACCLEYIEVSTEPEPRVKHYYRGRPAKWEPIYQQQMDEQLGFDDMTGKAEGMA